MSAFLCPYCGRPMVPKRPGDWHRPDAATRDHILPKALGGMRGTDNTRICCQRCNELRGALGHCAGALACFLSVLPEPSTTSVRRAGRVWAASDPMFARLPQ